MSNNAITLRVATKSDLPKILRLYAQPDLDDGRVLALGQAEAIFERMATYPDYRVYVALEDNTVVGTFAMLIMDNLGHLGAPSVVIEDVAVDPQQQGHGIGRQMMQYAMLLAREKGCYKVALSSNLKRTRAHQFYESLDFERHGYSYKISL